MTDQLDRLKAALADRYAIEREIGSGGMATVYLAQDLKHERQVALKVLRPELAAALGPERFLQEIKIAANLHHPHVLPLYDSGEAEGFLYYVMPFVEGESLRDRLEREKQFAIDDALQVAREVADALSYAHAHGVIHRDIKPENILLESEHAVVADFGIARAVDAAGGERLTETGIAIGTPSYMSPEQAGGEKDLDGRSDLYSLGCVLHEMLAGQPPFTGPTVESLVHQHLSAEPPSVTTIRPSVPGWIAAALERSLAKTPADRFNPVAQFGEAISARTSVTAADARPSPAASGGRRWLVPGFLAAALLVVIAVVLVRMVTDSAITIIASNIDHVTIDPGLEFQPAISPNGEEVAYVAGPIGNPRIIMRATRDVGTGGGVRLAEEFTGRSWFPAWTPDGTSVRFLVCPLGTPWSGLGCDWKETGKLGGPVRPVGIPHDSASYAWSKDGTRVAFTVRDSIFATAIDQSEPELLGLHPFTGTLNHSLVWSPDGRMIAYVNDNAAWRVSLNALGATIWVIDSDGGEPIPVVADEHMNVSPQWLPDSRHLLFVSNRDGPRGVYFVEVGREGARGSPRSVQGVISDPHSISVSANGRRLAYAKLPDAQNILSVGIPQAGAVSIKDAVPITAGSQIIETHSLDPSGDTIVFDGTLRGNTDLYKQPVAGGDAIPLLDWPGHVYSPRWSPDGAEIAFHYLPSSSNRAQIFVMPMETGVPYQLPAVGGDVTNPTWSPDGLTIAFYAWEQRRIWVISREQVGGEWQTPVQVTEFRCGFPEWDPDGRSLWCPGRDSTGARALVQVATDGEVLGRYGGWGEGPVMFALPRFSPDGSRIYFVGMDEDGSRGVWWIPADGGDATKAVAFDDPSLTVMGYLLSVGLEHLYLTVAELESDIYVMDLEW